MIPINKKLETILDILLLSKPNTGMGIIYVILSALARTTTNLDEHEVAWKEQVF